MYSKRLARYPKLRQEELSAVSKYLLITKGEIARLYGVTYTYLGENKIYLPRLSKYLKGFRRCAGKCKEVLPVKDFINEKINK